MKTLCHLSLLVSFMLWLSACQSEQKGHQRDRAEALETAKRLALGCHLYSQDNDGMLPARMADLKPYVQESYDPEAFILVASGKLQAIQEPARTVLLRLKDPLPGGQLTVAYVDGHAEIVPVK